MLPVDPQALGSALHPQGVLGWEGNPQAGRVICVLWGFTCWPGSRGSCSLLCAAHSTGEPVCVCTCVCMFVCASVCVCVVGGGPECCGGKCWPVGSLGRILTLRPPERRSLWVAVGYCFSLSFVIRAQRAGGLEAAGLWLGRPVAWKPSSSPEASGASCSELWAGPGGAWLGPAPTGEPVSCPCSPGTRPGCTWASGWRTASGPGCRGVSQGAVLLSALLSMRSSSHSRCPHSRHPFTQDLPSLCGC